MGKGVILSKVLAIMTVVMTVSSVSGIVIMLIIYQKAYELNPPTRPPTPNATDPLPTGLPPNMRLPKNLVPQRYDLHLQPLLYTQTTNTTNQTLAFKGSSNISFLCVERTGTIFLHSKDLSLTENTIRVNNVDRGKVVPVSGVRQHMNDTNFLEIQLNGELTVGSNYSLFIEFEGELGDNLAGLYVSKYTEKSTTDRVDDERLLVISQLQPTDARKVFPCFDEPAMKAEFMVTIIHREGTKALSNGYLKESNSVVIDGEPWEISTFHQTERMSTYLLAFTVSNFEYTSSPHDRVEIKIHARPQAIKAGHADYASGITKKMLSFYEGYLGRIYSFKKMDLVAAPDFGGVAMENWGLIMFRESALLYEEGVSSITNQEWIATVVAHELAHQWFGNLVTMKWWNNLWLNEGFATYLSYLGVGHLQPDWNMENLLVLNEIQTAFQVDSLASSHPLSCEENDVQTPSDITEQFDDISYSKGAALLRMLADYISKGSFILGLKKYLDALQYSNADNKDLWKHLQQAVNEDGGFVNVEELMYTWTNQMGYPLITINTTTGAVSQQHFLLNQTSTYDLVWHVPIRVRKSGDNPAIVLLKSSGPEMKAAFRANHNQWVLANLNCVGYYRVNYNPENWARLLDQMETDPQEIPVINRGQLIDDAFNLARAGHVNVTLALSTTRYLRNDTEFVPWEVAIRNFNYFLLMFDRSEVYGPMQAYLQNQVQGLYQHFENVTLASSVPDSHSDQYNQINAVNVACKHGLPACQTMVQELFKIWMLNHTNIIHPNLRYSVYCQAVALGGEEEWEFAWRMFQNATSATEKDKLRYALSCTRKIWLLNRYLEYTLDPDKIRKMNAVSTINYVAENVAGQALAWDFVRAHWIYLSQEYGGGIMSFSSLIDGVTQRFSTDFELQQLKQFQSAHGEQGLGSASRALEQAIERTQANIQWVKKNKKTVLEWFKGELRRP
ncbi:alanyl (membrane) aminopeptidase-like b [Osmerus mordax]|uniref:alanyl (membrane) aminopeptidase-like b n=1 Tax=Osmerus mordax TaxID=8014 RepID=UPI00351079A7